MKNRLSLFFFIFLGSFLSCDTQKSPVKDEKSSVVILDSMEAIGLWQVPKEGRYISGKNNGTNWSSGPSIERFEYDGKYITLMLFCEKAWMWKTPDDYYKVNSKWGHDTLYYLPPFGRWAPLVVFKNRSFTYSYEIEDSLYTWTYKKISSTEVDSGYTDILKSRKPHDYSIKPTDAYKE